MARHFGAQHTASNYSAMGNAMGRPRYPSARNRSVAEAIAHARRIAANEAKAKAKPKK